MQPRTWSTLLILGALAASASAQCSSGPFIGVPFAMLFHRPGIGGYSGAELYHRGLGFGPGVPQTWAGGPTLPRFSFQLAASHCSFWQPPYPDLDAISIGADWVMADSNTGRVHVPLNSWGALTLSVTRGSRGAGDPIRHEAGTRGGAHSDLFTYTLPGSDLPHELVGDHGMVHRALDQSEVALGGQFTDADVGGLDLFAQLVLSVDFIRNALPAPPALYFSVTPATVNNMPPGLQGMSPATIFRMTWNAAQGRWSCPMVWKTHADLGLRADENVDALAVDAVTQRMLFSTAGTAPDEIMFLNLAADHAAAVPYADQNGIPVSTHIGLLIGDDLDAICAMDPATVATAGISNGLPYFMGTPRPRQFRGLPPADLDAAAYRTHPPDAFATFVKGWPASGRAPGFALLFLTPKDSPLELVFLGVVARDPQDPVCGNPVRLDLPVPVAPVFRNVQVDLRWFVTDMNLSAIHEAWPIQIRL